MLRKSVSTLLFVAIVVTFIFSMMIVVNDAEAKRTHKYIIAVWQETWQDEGKTIYCGSEYVTTAKSTETHEDHPAGVKVHYGSSTLTEVDPDCEPEDAGDAMAGDETTN